MTIARKALAAAAIAGLGMAGFAAQADAAPNPVRPPAKPKAFSVGLMTANISPKSFQGTAGTKLTISGTVGWAGDTAANMKLNFNPSPASFVSCKATQAGEGGQLNPGNISWTNLAPSSTPRSTTFTIVCTLNRDIYTSDVAEDTLKVTSTGADQASGTYTYKINGTITAPTASPKPTTKPTAKPTAPVKDKDSSGGLSKTGF